MKPVFRLYRRNGIFYSHDSRTGKQESLKTRDRGTAQRLLNTKNEAAQNPAAVNLQIARHYVAADHPEMLTPYCPKTQTHASAGLSGRVSVV